MQEYYEKIAEKVNRHKTSSSGHVYSDRYYVYKINRFCGSKDLLRGHVHSSHWKSK